jgi:hypothetical protein
MTARDTIAAAMRGGTDWDTARGDIKTYWLQEADVVLRVIRGMSHDELRELRPDIAILFDATKDTANTRGDYIINLIVGRLRAVERLHTEIRGRCGEDGFDWPCRTTRAVRGQA